MIQEPRELVEAAISLSLETSWKIAFKTFEVWYALTPEPIRQLVLGPFEEAWEQAYTEWAYPDE
jgi:hypothetical protein